MDKLLEFLQKAGKLKDIERSGWKRNKVERPESVADHSWRTAMMAFILAKRLGLDESKAMKMAIVHDLGESEIGDYMPHELAHDHKQAKEREAMKTICSKLGKEGEEIFGLWEEFEHGKSKEGKLVKELDKLEMALQAAEYENGGRSKDLGEFISHTEKFLKSKEMKKLLEDIKSMRSLPIK